LANGSYDLQFSHHNAATNGNQVGTSITHDVSVSNGVFTAQRDDGDRNFRVGAMAVGGCAVCWNDLSVQDDRDAAGA
jgi:hypothetical protein